MDDRLAPGPAEATRTGPVPAVPVGHLRGHEDGPNDGAVVLAHLSLDALVGAVEAEVPETSSVPSHVANAQVESPQRYALGVEFLRARRIVPHPQRLQGVLVQVPTTLQLAAPVRRITASP